MATNQLSRETTARRSRRLLAGVTNEEPLHSKLQVSPNRDDTMLASRSWRRSCSGLLAENAYCSGVPAVEMVS